MKKKQIGMLVFGMACVCVFSSAKAYNVNAAVGVTKQGIICNWPWSAKKTTATEEKKGYVFKSGETELEMNKDVESILKALGKYKSYAETTSCAFKGKDKIYSYEGFDIYTYPVEKKDYVNSVYFTNKTITTPEGIHIGSTLKEMTAAYGTDYKEEFGVYQYTKDKSILSIMVTKNVVESIEYMAIVQ